MLLSDDEIVQRVLHGDINTYAALIDRHRQCVFRIVVGHVPHDRAEEVVHETFVNAYKGLSSYRGGEKFPNWLSRIAVRCCYDFWRENGRNREIAFSLPEDSVECLERLMADTAMTTYQDAARSREAQTILEWALRQLSPEDRMVITLTALEEKSVAEAAELLGWSRVNVKVRALRVRRKLKDILAQAGISEV
ncbi:sigma-70 family RNA polymerase sigma factor [Desulfovibrio subterraneus]|uniref:Putative alternative RNA polymerase sigma factor SigM n=1 Tax=Desulfovibrio subterraneus TaxID=2718620 RepID=A0A7J0BKU0_9BACT|nr:sigma-70 family RNA polymerase sigma factor [Desulfovibrio subterraneus]WBF68418.1 sigma-70 family RNA polymerase sigma factor [Desulfovibrio subterraneus]GFM34373.1 putative alternative RNA polymerase sigma factor SigM [Desulfovibrio subterraneus]